MSRGLLKAAVLSISLLLLAATAVSPALANIGAVFTEASPRTIMLLVALPSMTMVLASLLFGKLSEWATRRELTNAAMVLFLIGGVTPYFMDDLTLILGMRAILGLSLGMIFPLSLVLIADFFSANERVAVMGLQSVFVNAGGIIFPLAGGILCVADWHNTFLAYLFGAVIFAFVYFYLPEPPKAAAAGESGQAARKVPLPGRVYFVEGIVFFYNLLIFAFFTNVAIQVVGEDMGNAASAGYALTLFTGGGVLAGLVFGRIMQIAGNFTIAAGWLVTAAGLAIISGVHDFNLLLLGCFIGGFGFSTTCPALFVTLSLITPPARVALSLPLASAAGGIGQFAAPFVFEAVNALFGQHAGRFPLLVSAAVLAAGGLLLALQTLARPPQAANINN
ncbi:MFS transporter [Acetonema longum]|uniref:Major facilitator superfamily (MFS) profile domain-containing protein n=1 Tax=Acetonema longum DSM 6540 TaxID=1009370 RepID=F7NN55_9FIRM|nr:MFS transporter [Acetonema longum]EGO62521.1 hypothetical protein ALO_17691 [Acetonema longum DSM 6540]